MWGEEQPGAGRNLYAAQSTQIFIKEFDNNNFEVHEPNSIHNMNNYYVFV